MRRAGSVSAGQSDAEQSQGSAGQCQRRWDLAQQRPGQQDGQRRDEVGGDAQPPGGHPGQRVRPRGERQRGRDQP